MDVYLCICAGVIAVCEVYIVVKDGIHNYRRKKALHRMRVMIDDAIEAIGDTGED